ncbi:MAG: hypothetical protein HQ517_11335 [SAR324 cluster bacterium]|nr:hypothetical protein [SAR324 cluster bacterium]
MVKKKPTPNPKLYKSIFQARFDPKLSFFEKMVSTAKEFSEFPHWQADGLSVVLRDYEKKRSLAIRHNQFNFDQDFGNQDDQSRFIFKVLEILPNSLDVSEFTRLGYRRQYLINVQMRFGELVSIMNLKFLSQNKKLKKLIPKQLEDTSYTIVSSEEGMKFNILIGPVKKQEIPNRISFNKEHHLDPNTSQKEYIDILENYPDVSVFIDIDCFRTENNIPSDEAQAFFKTAQERISLMVEEINSYIFSKEIG